MILYSTFREVGYQLWQVGSNEFNAFQLIEHSFVDSAKIEFKNWSISGFYVRRSGNDRFNVCYFFLVYRQVHR